MELYRLEEPETSASYFLNASDIIKIKKLLTGDEDKSIPEWKVKLNYKKNYSLQESSELAGSVTPTRKEFLKKEFRSVSASDEAIKNIHLLSPIIERDSLLIDNSDAQIEATRLFLLYKQKRERYQITISAIYDFKLMQTINIKIPRMNLNNGKNFVILGIRYLFSQNKIMIDCWG